VGELPATAGPELLRQVAAIVNSPDFQNHAEHRGVTLYAPIRAAADAPAAEGIDLSGYQPTVDWTKVAASGIAFAFIKATEGTTLIDHTFADHWARAKRASLLRGAYHFFDRSRMRPRKPGFFSLSSGIPASCRRCSTSRWSTAFRSRRLRRAWTPG